MIMYNIGVGSLNLFYFTSLQMQLFFNSKIMFLFQRYSCFYLCKGCFIENFAYWVEFSLLCCNRRRI